MASWDGELRRRKKRQQKGQNKQTNIKNIKWVAAVKKTMHFWNKRFPLAKEKRWLVYWDIDNDVEDVKV